MAEPYGIPMRYAVNMSRHEELFKRLVSAYYNDNFREVLTEVLSQEREDLDFFTDIVSVLCGVDIEYDDKYVRNLIRAITNYQVNKKVIAKVGECSESCRSATGRTRCQSICPFNAIVRDPITKTFVIDDSRCIGCGLCVDACDSSILMDRVELLPVASSIRNGEKVIAAVAPAIAGQFGENVTLDMLREAFAKAGFADMVEVAFFADMLTLKEAVEFDKLVQNAGDLMITSCCCPMWVGMLKKIYYDLVPDLSPSVSPMIAAGRILKELNKDVRVVFIGPCIAKKTEAKDPDIAGVIDAVLTFQEVKVMFDALEIDPGNMSGVSSMEYASRGGRLYARTGGVSAAVGEAIEEMFPLKYRMFKSVQANGVKECKALLDMVKSGEVGDVSFIEGMGCAGGCVGGPKGLIPKESGLMFVEKSAQESVIKVAANSYLIDEILGRFGVHDREDFKDHAKTGIFERTF
ncbi:[Fe-Fe] hydrogenase large subunit C-terminal domain-containing protein [Youngiibacter fragilis]|uniref:Iron hydrogenase n=1 Tax=Youngiibacter fragilis 232.1 TaxID=994573 RepID=V7I1F8_9CLOT|nr:[Fe-Fe] hydrogenase large subunit C-terminal domain-containing protein [Youngiibacter fragilis]ETA79029.1 iron hydrogenase [Youngiibacter fragilis 232.1]